MLASGLIYSSTGLMLLASREQLPITIRPSVFCSLQTAPNLTTESQYLLHWKKDRSISLQQVQMYMQSQSYKRTSWNNSLEWSSLRLRNRCFQELGIWEQRKRWAHFHEESLPQGSPVTHCWRLSQGLDICLHLTYTLNKSVCHTVMPVAIEGLLI